jgi:hypothetical protein
MTLQVLTANRLRDGAVVFLAADGRWAPRIGNARAEAEPQALAALEVAGRAAVADRTVVEPYLIAVERTAAGAIRALRYRERLRAQGPSVRLDLGKQAEAPAADRETA